ncbi:hypothetical protein ACFXG4_38145 [Nocardia sp. NPDC059246]|uniref:hypothetical protein n=1 Tax=unclassified Nocardia TaxID=2637762 RepID=UPI0036C1B066
MPVTTGFGITNIGEHAIAAEVRGAITNPIRRERIRYQPKQWAHGPNLVEHTPDGEKWRGSAAAEELTHIAPGIVLVSPPVDTFYDPGAIDGHSRVPTALTAMETLVAWNLKQVQANQARFSKLYKRAEPGLMLVCAHDPSMLKQAQATA